MAKTVAGTHARTTFSSGAVKTMRALCFDVRAKWRGRGMLLLFIGSKQWKPKPIIFIVF